ncbi:MAG: hypothetical protein M1301_00560 [Candidatus Thermoplasmatota archaeon]|nr:hypothetical protein [Candidatus Thermoplasmatota archaeon]
MSKTITVNINEKILNEFREKAALRYGKRKGVSGKGHDRSYGSMDEEPGF